MDDLEIFIKERLGEYFNYKITNAEVQIIFDTFQDNKKHNGITIKNTSELERFSNLLNGRKVKLIGNFVGSDTHVICINILELSI